MTRIATLLAAAAAIGGLAAPAAAQSPYPYGYQQPYPQPYPQAYPQTYPQQAYPGYAQPYGNQGYTQNPLGTIIDQLLGNRYNVTDRQAVRQCAQAAMTQAAVQYRAYGYGNGAYGNNGYSQPYGNNGYGYGNNGYNQQYAGSARVTAITNVQRMNNGLRVSGVLGSGGYAGGQYGGQHGYQNQGYAAGAGDLSFRCNVDYRGVVTNLRVRPNVRGY